MPGVRGAREDVAAALVEREHEVAQRRGVARGAHQAQALAGGGELASQEAIAAQHQLAADRQERLLRGALGRGRVGGRRQRPIRQRILEDDAGLAAVTGKPEDRGKLRTPTLRNVAITGPYMHDGSLKTLDDVVTFYYRGVPETSPDGLPLDVKPLISQSFSEIPDLVAFLESLTDVLRQRGAEVLEGPADGAAVLDIAVDETGQRVLSVSARNIPREYEVFYAVTFSLRVGAESLIDNESMAVTRAYTYDETQVLAKAAEEASRPPALVRFVASLWAATQTMFPPFCRLAAEREPAPPMAPGLSLGESAA